jgi:hypothetical protein
MALEEEKDKRSQSQYNFLHLKVGRINPVPFSKETNRDLSEIRIQNSDSFEGCSSVAFVFKGFLSILKPIRSHLLVC